jgi:predicted RNase H-like nuclease
MPPRLPGQRRSSLVDALEATRSEEVIVVGHPIHTGLKEVIAGGRISRAGSKDVTRDRHRSSLKWRCRRS